MSFQLEGGNATAADYDYESGSGLDSFISRSLDEVSWQSSGLGSTYTTLNNLPIGTSPTSSTPTNYDQTQVSGSQGGAVTLGGGSASGSGGTSSGQVTIDGVNGAITIQDSNGNTVGVIGNLNG